MRHYILTILLALGLVSCAGWDMGSFSYKDPKKGIEVGCVDTGTGTQLCTYKNPEGQEFTVEVPRKKDTPDEPESK